jgi:integrase
MAHKGELGTDSEGRYRRSIGWKPGNGAKPVQHLFRLGRDEEKARLANVRLERLWETVVARWKIYKAEGRTDEAGPLWDDVTLAIGQAIAKGEAVCTLNPPPNLEGSPAAAASWVAVLQMQFPMIVLRLPEAAMREGVEGLKRQQQQERDNTKLTQDLLSALGQTTGQTLHQALEAYSAYVAEVYSGRPSLRPQQLSITLLKKHAEDITLDRLGADGIEKWLAYWCRRPQGGGGKPLAFTTCRNVLIDTRRFLRWLHRSPEFAWHMPDGFTFRRCRIDKTPAERVRKRLHFNRDELKLIWQNAKPWDRALILLALNCGFSKREIATLQLGEIVKGKAHFFIKRYRTKTDKYGEWLLWPETMEALDYLKQFRPDGATYVVANQNGKPLTRQTKQGNENGVIRNHWQLILDRIAKDHPDFYRLPFKHLRKTGSTYIRHMNIPNAAELATMYLAHGEESDTKDTLLSVYASRAWKKLHKALLKLRKKLLPVFATVEKPWESSVMRITPATRAKVKELRAQGMKLADIAAHVGLHHLTVGKLCKAR